MTFLLTKAINAERAALKAPIFANKNQTARATLLKMMVILCFNKLANFEWLSLFSFVGRLWW